MKKFLLCFLALMLVVMLALIAGVMAPNANAPNQVTNPVSESLPAECAAIGIIVLVSAVIATDTGQLVRRAKLLLDATLTTLNKLRAFGKSPHWGVIRLKPILT